MPTVWGFTPTGGQPPTTGESLLAAQVRYASIIRADGGSCPCCARWGKVLPRRVHEQMARTLLWMHHRHGSAWVHMPSQAPRWAVDNREYPLLHYWELIEAQPNQDDPTKRAIGVWRVTAHGAAWIDGRVRIARTVYIFNNEIVDRSVETVSLPECFGLHFNYADIMASL